MTQYRSHQPPDDPRVRKALAAAGVPVEAWPEFLRFQRLYGGLGSQFGLTRVTWGIFHLNPEWVRPAAVDAELDDEDGETWLVVCLDSHPSDEIMIDQNGRMYGCGQLVAAHYDEYFTED